MTLPVYFTLLILIVVAIAGVTYLVDNSSLFESENNK